MNSVNSPFIRISFSAVETSSTVSLERPVTEGGLFQQEAGGSSSGRADAPFDREARLEQDLFFRNDPDDGAGGVRDQIGSCRRERAGEYPRRIEAGRRRAVAC